jgi:hypothetical protein
MHRRYQVQVPVLVGYQQPASLLVACSLPPYLRRPTATVLVPVGYVECGAQFNFEIRRTYDTVA